MGRNVEDIIAGLPRQRRSRINQKARQMAGEMIAQADSLGEVRKVARKTQSQMGEALGMPQNAISQLERRSDVLLSTLARYVDALGAELDLIVRMRDGTEIVLAGLGRAVKTAPKKSTHRKKAASRVGRKAA